MGAAHTAYVTALSRAPLSAETRRTYASKVRGYLAWLDTADVDGDPLTHPARDWAVRDYRTHLAAVLKRSNSIVNNALAAVDDFYTRRGLARRRTPRPTIRRPASSDREAVLRWLRAANAVNSARDRALVLVPFYTGARIAEIVALDVDDVRLSARKGTVRFYGKGGKPRGVELHPEPPRKPGPSGPGGIGEPAAGESTELSVRYGMVDRNSAPAGIRGPERGWTGSDVEGLPVPDRTARRRG